MNHEHNEKCKKEENKVLKNKNVLNELFDVNKFLADKNMVTRYSEHLNKLLIKS